MINKNSMCEKITYEIKLILLKIYHYYDDYVNPPCYCCGVKKSS